MKKLTSFRVIIGGFLIVILIGCVLLMLPCSTAEGKSASFMDALFTSVSSVCVTGLVTQDTATYWSGFGQGVILFLIQIGGLGVVSSMTILAFLSGKKINLKQRSTMQEAVSAPQVGGVVRFTGFILKTTFIIEFVGFLAMLPVFCNDFGVKGIWYSLFHSVSAFCNAGFDLMGTRGQFSSLTSYSGNPILNIIVMLLIICGGLGFMTWEDIVTNKFRIKKYRTQSKVILVTTGLLLLLPAVYFYFCEFSADHWEMGQGEQILSSLFQSTTTRTAGFNTVDFSVMKSGSIAIMIVLMLIGGSSGSTAGGMKTTTFAVLISSAISVFRNKEETVFFGRRISKEVVAKAASILIMYIILFLTGGIVISAIEELPLGYCLFETASAIGTVGLSMGLTPTLGTVSHIILMVLMFLGRVGSLTFIYAAFSPKANNNIAKYPLDKITVG